MWRFCHWLKISLQTHSGTGQITTGWVQWPTAPTVRWAWAEAPLFTWLLYVLTLWLVDHSDVLGLWELVSVQSQHPVILGILVKDSSPYGRNINRIHFALHCQGDPFSKGSSLPFIQWVLGYKLVRNRLRDYDFGCFKLRLLFTWPRILLPIQIK